MKCDDIAQYGVVNVQKLNIFTSFRPLILFLHMLGPMVMSVLLYLFTLLPRGVLCYRKMRGRSTNQNAKIISNGGL